MAIFSKSYPYPELTKQLKFLCNPSQYQKIIEKHKTQSGHVLLIPEYSIEYLDILPYYVFAQCPFCNKRYSILADTHGLYTWHPRNDHIDSYAEDESTCKHFFGIHKFINLHDQEPVELNYFSNSTGEVPRLTPWFLPEDIQTFVVLHGLPICRIVKEEFVPFYTLFILTYFSQDPKFLLKRHYQAEAERGKGDPEFYPGFFSQPALYKREVKKIPATYYALEEKAMQGQLGWMDFTNPDLPLSIGTGKQLPEIYRSIEGKRYQYEWKNGKFMFYWI